MTTERSSPPLVSVVTPFYNTAAYLAECIESVLAQRDVPFEYLLVNNLSTDGSREIAAAYAAKDPRIRLLDNAAFVGQVENYNGALARIDAASSFVKIVQADDTILPDCLRRMVDVARQDPRIGLVTSRYRMGDQTCGLDFPFTASRVSGRDVCRDMLLSGRFYLGSPTTVMYRADIVRARRPFYALGRYHEDTEAAYEILLEHDLGFVPEVLSVMRVEHASLTGATRRFEGDILDRVINIERYGASVLGRTEFEELRARQWELYDHLLGSAALRRREGAFWEYHRRGLETIGRRLGRRDIAWNAARQIAYLARQPFRTGLKGVTRAALTLLNRSASAHLRSGEWVEVRSRQEILRTLDANGRLDGLPFMPQMFQYCGTRLRVAARAHKTCDTDHRAARRMDRAVHLDDVRCDGRAYEGCAAACLIYWKEAWLKRVTDETASRRDASVDTPARCTAEMVVAGTRAADWSEAAPRYVCQATQLMDATTALPWWDVRQYLEDYESGNVGLRDAIAAIASACRRALSGGRPRRSETRLPMCAALYNRARGDGDGRRTRLDVAPGGFVSVRPDADVDAGLSGCSGVYSVRSRVERIIDPRTGRFMPIRPGTVVLDGVWCTGQHRGDLMFCPRAILPVVPETWLVSEPRGEHHP